MSASALDAFEFGPVIGKGSFGEVRAAVNIHTLQEVAVKIIGRASVEQQLEEEVRIHRLLDHPNVVRLYDVIEEDNYTYILLELVEGQELRNYLSQHDRLSEEEARRIFRQIVEGVEHCHGRNVVHRDLKLENILLDRDLNVKIIDFGLAAELQEEDELLTRSCGSLDYAAPEIIRRTDVEYKGPEVDVWSCGVILYALLCARLPFEPESVHDLEKAISEGRYTLPGFLSEEAGDLLIQMLWKDRAGRISIPQIKTHCWFQGKPFAIDSPAEALSVSSVAVPISRDPTLLTTSFVLQELGRPRFNRKAAGARVRVSSRSRRLRHRVANGEAVHAQGCHPGAQNKALPSPVAPPVEALVAQGSSFAEQPAAVSALLHMQDPTLLTLAFVWQELGRPPKDTCLRTACATSHGCVRGRRLRFRAAQRTDASC